MVLKSFRVKEELEKSVVPLGNGSMVLTPKRWIGQKVKVILEEKDLNVEKEVLKKLDPYLHKIEGIYLFGSHVRGEQTQDSDVDVLVISDTLKLKKEGIFDFLTVPKDRFLEGLQKTGDLFYPQIVQEAKPIFNEKLLEEFRKTKIRPDLKHFLDMTQSAIRIVEQDIKIDKQFGDKEADAEAAIYSMILRLKTMFLIRLFLEKERFSNAKFKKFLEQKGLTKEQASQIFKMYQASRDHKKIDYTLKVEEKEQLLNIAKNELAIVKEKAKKLAAS